MGRSSLLSSAVVLLAVWTGACSSTDPSPVDPSAVPTAAAGAAGDIFDQTVLHEVRIVIDPADWQALRDNFRSNDYYAANISLDGVVLQQVGIRSRGDGSRNPDKPALKVDFNKYVKEQEYFGTKTIVLDNMFQDPSMIAERLAYAVYEGMGIPAPAISHCRLTVNDQFWGVYAVIQSVNKPFLKSRLGEESGNLFDYEYIDDWRFTIRGEVDAYVPLPFDPETNEDKLDASALVNFVAAATEASDAGFLTEIAKFLDVDRFLTYLATENALAERDGFVGQQGMNNFFLYQLGGTTRFVVIPWDKDTAFTAADWPIDFNVNENVLTRRILADPAKNKVYRDAVGRAGRSFVNPRFLGPRLEQAYSQIRAAVLLDTRKPNDNDTFELAIQGLRGLIAGRETNIIAQTP